uniref:Peptidyl-prolyl cis-trans isomerase n=1 Tax=Cacopsylla melanoneura TaxID=428564 RepID=A0A8D8UQI9_9HEMI
MAIVLETSLGDLTIDLFTDSRPRTCQNFLKLCKMKYYNLNLFHTVQQNFIAQTGDPTGEGSGGTSIFGLAHGSHARYYEAEKMPKVLHTKPGLLSMVNCGDGMLGSQFFITLAPDLGSLNEHCVFGEVTEGFDVLLKLNNTICNESHRPYQDIRITHTVVLDDPYEDLPELVYPDRSPEPSRELLANGLIGADEAIDETQGNLARRLTKHKVI